MIVSGAGPAGAVCATILARAGARVTLFDRARFPRPKLCGDTLNPGAMRILASIRSVEDITARSLPLDGMLLTGPGTAVRASYGEGIHGRAIVRRDLDALLLDAALAAGVEFHDQTTVLAPLLDRQDVVTGIKFRRGDGGTGECRAAFIVAADGRESRLARAVGLTRHAAHLRRWAVGGYFAGGEIDRRYGQMHVRSGHYIGVAPVPGDLTNVCLVVPYARGRAGWRNPAALLQAAITDDSALAPAFAASRLVDNPHVLGPMAVDARAVGVPGMLLAGDAAGFIDPITGDGLRLALESAVLTADVVTAVLSGDIDRRQAPRVLRGKRRAAFATKWRFNRAVRRLVATPRAIGGAAVAAKVFPALFQAVIRYAGDATQSSHFQIQSSKLEFGSSKFGS